MVSIEIALLAGLAVVWIALYTVLRGRLTGKIKIYPLALIARFGYAMQPMEEGRLRSMISALGWLGVAASIILMAIFYLFAFNTVRARLSGGGGAGAGVVPLIPGVTVALEDLVYIAFALGVAVFFHEAAHAVMARAERVKVRDFGLALFFFIPAAFVELDDKSLEKASISSKLKIFSAGVLANAVIAVAVMAAFTGLTPILFEGVAVLSVEDGSPADEGGIEEGMTIVAVNGEPVKTVDDLRRLLEEAGVRDPGRRAELTIEVVTENGGRVELSVEKPEGRDSIGVIVANKPASPLAPLLSALLIINLSLAAINAAPILLPLPRTPVVSDGGHIVMLVMERLLGERGRLLGASVGLATLLIILSMVTFTPVRIAP